ncbi:MAG TPA: TonB-dependent receptor [Azospirillaceae bacterium]|nr:TonB-dependent receptor [Azospirillaceae bacterium]
MRATHRVRPTGALILAGLVPALPLHAQTAGAQTAGAQNAVTAAELVVTATRLPTPAGRVGSSVTVVPGDRLRAEQRTQLADALARVPGVSLQRNGGIGSTTTIRLRGSEPGQVKVLVDGVPVNDTSSANAEFDFNALLASGIERVEVLRGPQSALWGNDAMGGVVNVVTRRASSPLELEAAAEAGAYRTFRQSAAARGLAGGADYSVSLDHLRTAGFSRTAAGPERDATNLWNGKARFGFAVTETLRLEASGGREHLRTAFDPSITRDGPATQEKDTLHGRAAALLDLPGLRLRQTLAAYGSRTERDFEEPLGTNPASTFDGVRRGADYQADLSLRRADALTLGLSREVVTAETTSTSRAGVLRRGIDEAVGTNAAFAQYSLAATEALTLTLGGRHDDNSRFGGNGTWRATAAWAVAEGTTLRASYGTGAKAPTLFQLFDASFGNAGLDVERSRGADLGVAQSFWGGRVVLEAGLFRNRFRDLIAFTGRYVNVARARTRGAEAAVALRPLDGLELAANHTWLDSRDPATGLDLPRRPRHTTNLSLDWTPRPGALLGANLRRVTRQRDRAADPSPVVPGYTAVDLRASVRVLDGVELFGRVENLGGEHYQEVRGYNTPGRSAHGGVRVEF